MTYPDDRATRHVLAARLEVELNRIRRRPGPLRFVLALKPTGEPEDDPRGPLLRQAVAAGSAAVEAEHHGGRILRVRADGHGAADVLSVGVGALVDSTAENLRAAISTLVHPKVREAVSGRAEALAERWPWVSTFGSAGAELANLVANADPAWPPGTDPVNVARWVRSAAALAPFERLADALLRHASEQETLGAINVPLPASDWSGRPVWDRPTVLRSVCLALIAEAEAEAVVEIAAGAALGDHQPSRDALARLGAELSGRLTEVRRCLGLPHSQRDLERQTVTRGGLLEIDALAAELLERLGPAGREAAEKFREKAAVRVRRSASADEPPWLPWVDPTFLPRWVAKVIWEAEVRPRLEREHTRPAAISVPVLRRIARTHARGLSVGASGDPLLVDRHGCPVGAELRRVDPLGIPALEQKQVGALMARGTGLLGSLTAHRLLRFEVVTAHRQVLDGNPDARAIRTEGGWSELARRVGAAGNRAAEEVHAVVAAQAHLCWRWPDGTEGNLLSYTVRPAAGHRPALVSLVLGDPLLPDFVHALGKGGRRARESRRLVPVVDLPPTVGRPNEHGPQATLQLLLLAEMRASAREIALRGGVLLSRERWERLAEAADLPPGDLLQRVLDRWTRDGDDGPALLEVVERDRFRLGPAHAAARDFLERSGRFELQGQEAGQRAARRRRIPRTGPGGSRGQ
jgi:hypothetical protein